MLVVGDADGDGAVVLVVAGGGSAAGGGGAGASTAGEPIVAKLAWGEPIGSPVTSSTTPTTRPYSPGGRSVETGNMAPASAPPGTGGVRSHPASSVVIGMPPTTTSSPAAAHAAPPRFATRPTSRATSPAGGSCARSSTCQSPGVPAKRIATGRSEAPTSDAAFSRPPVAVRPA